MCNYLAKLLLNPTSSLRINFQLIEELNGFNQLGSLIRWKKLALFVKNFANQKFSSDTKVF